MSRPKGSKNVNHVTARENLITVFNRVGGIEHMTDWATANPTDFYKLYGRLVPQEVKAGIDPEANALHLKVSFVAPQSPE